MHVPVLVALPILLATGLGAVPAPAPAADDPSIVMTARPGTRLLVEPDRAGVVVIGTDVSAAPGVALEGVRVSAQAGDEPACGEVPETLTGSTRVHCEQALPAIPAGSTRLYSFTAQAQVDGKDVSRTLDFEAAATPVTITLKVAGKVRSDSPVGGGAALPQVAPSSTVPGELVLANPGADAVTVAVPGWVCPGTSLAAGGSLACTRSAKAPTTQGGEGSLDAAVTLTDGEGRTGTFRRSGRFVTTGGPLTPVLADTGLPVGPTLAAALGMIGAGVLLRRAARPGVR